MPVTVTTQYDTFTLDTGSDWDIDIQGNLTVTSTSEASVATYAKDHWYSVAKTKPETIHVQFEEAIELLTLVDNGKFTNQDDDWKERVGILLDD